MQQKYNRLVPKNIKSQRKPGQAFKTHNRQQSIIALNVAYESL